MPRYFSVRLGNHAVTRKWNALTSKINNAPNRKVVIQTETTFNNHSNKLRPYIFLPADCLEKVTLEKLKNLKALLIDETRDELLNARLERKCGFPPIPAFLRRKNLSETVTAPVVTSISDNSAWVEKHLEWSSLPALYLQLSKARLSALVVITALGGYAACPSLWDPLTLAACASGTCLTAFGANALNQCLEAPFDAQMKRTQNRVLPRGILTPVHATLFGVASCAAGVTILVCGANVLAASLAFSNFFLYSAIYTPMKRFSIYNTWVGSIVGAIPPLIGWTACGDGSLDASALVLAAILFAWQFPHFNALSWNLRADYSKAGYRMMAVTRPDLLRRTALTYSLSLIGLSSLAAPVTGLTSIDFAFTSLPLNLYFSFLAWNFYRRTDSRNSKKLFRCSLLYLPVLMTLMLLSKPNT